MDDEDEDYKPRAEDPLVEPLFAGLSASDRVAGRARRPAGCGAALLLLSALLVLLA